ncbi:uncharacterized protein LOC117303993 [Asterias rubens]|uniref:uncharacterized protein LOC117303993 n=1 Tax=Asterias rubens TaxID=7604 RepID=UPI001455CDBE|nr:uncharacterized protein LOC117303993 [Asterias rubens]
MPTYKLTYFNARGLAELARLMFAEKGVEYEDVRIERDQWPDMKPNTPQGQLPILEVDGQVIPQSKAFCRYLAREFGFYGSTSLDTACVDVVCETIDDLLQGLRKFFAEQNEEEKAKKKAEFYSDGGNGQVVLKRLEKLLGNDDYFVENKLSLADFSMMMASDWYLRNSEGAMDNFPTLLALRKRVMELPKIAKWIETRPVTEFKFSNKMPSYKLNYFNVRGRGEVSRLCFVVAGVPFEDFRVEFADWPALKPKMPNGAMPVLEVDGKMLPETQAIQGYLAREFNLAGTNNWESALVNVVAEMISDLKKPFSDKVFFEKDEAKKAESTKTYFEETAPPMFKRLEERLKANGDGDGYFVGNKISLADIIFFNGMDNVLKVKATALDDYPKLKALRGRVAALKEVAAYLEKRPVTNV